MPHLHHTIVIGAGQAGLAAGYYLQQAGQDFLIIDGHERVGDNWRTRWAGLRLFSPQRYNALPGLPPPGGDWHLPSRLELADYLEDYAKHFSLPLNLACTCDHARKTDDGHWVLSTNKGELRARHLVVATGAYRTPKIPQAVADTFPATVEQLHSSEVRDPQALADENTDVLVVGAGASGQQLARLFAQTGAAVTLAGSEVGNLPRRFLGKDIYWWLYHSGMMRVPTDRFPGKQIFREDSGVVTVAEPALPPEIRRVKTHLVAYREGYLRWACRKTAPAATPWPTAGKKGLVVWCTGFANRYPWLPARMLGEDGQPLLDGARSAVFPEVVFLGLPNLRRPNSSLVGGVGADANAVL